MESDTTATPQPNPGARSWGSWLRGLLAMVFLALVAQALAPFLLTALLSPLNLGEQGELHFRCRSIGFQHLHLGELKLEHTDHHLGIGSIEAEWSLMGLLFERKLELLSIHGTHLHITPLETPKDSPPPKASPSTTPSPSSPTPEGMPWPPFQVERFVAHGTTLEAPQLGVMHLKSVEGSLDQSSLSAEVQGSCYGHLFDITLEGNSKTWDLRAQHRLPPLVGTHLGWSARYHPEPSTWSIEAQALSNQHTIDLRVEGTGLQQGEGEVSHGAVQLPFAWATNSNTTTIQSAGNTILKATTSGEDLKLEGRGWHHSGDRFSGRWEFKLDAIPSPLTLEVSSLGAPLPTQFDVTLSHSGHGAKGWEWEPSSLSLSLSSQKRNHLKLSGGFAHRGAACKNVRVDLPLQKGSGQISAQLSHPALGMGLLEGEWLNDGSKLELSGSIPWEDMPPFEISAGLHWAQPRLQAEVVIPPTQWSTSLDAHGWEGAHFSANVQGDVRLALSPADGIEQSLELRWNEGFLTNEDMSTTALGVRGHLSSDRLTDMATGPRQVLGWERVSAQGVTLNDGELHWQWEKEQRLFLESFRTDWCGGQLHLQAMRLQWPPRAIDLTLFAESIQLDQVLSQFNAGQIEGKGELGGKISLRLDGQNLTFDDAYLYTAPDTEGVLKIHEAIGLDEAMSQNQLQLVRASLNDYRYKWARLQFQADEEDLLLNLAMDGKPAHLLPFGFDRKTGSFFPDPKGPGVNLPGLRLNTNFRSPQLWPMINTAMKWLKRVEISP